MTEPDDEKIDLSALAPELTRRAERAAQRTLSRLTSHSSPGHEVSRRLARFAMPALLAAAASIALMLATKPSAPRTPDALDRLMLQGRPVPILTVMVAMESDQ
jgi:hypothetical protein